MFPKCGNYVTIIYPVKILNKGILIIVLISGCLQTKDQKVQSYLLKGNQALASKEYQDAVEYFELVLKADNGNTDALNNLGIAYSGLNNQIEAIKQYSLALTIDSLHYDSRYNRFNAYYSHNKFTDALTDLSILKKVYPDSAQVSFAFGLAYTKLKNYSKAKQSFDLALEQGWDEVEILINKGNLSFYQGDLNAAKNDILLALKLDSLQGLAYNSLALITIEENESIEALPLIDKALWLDPGHPYYLNNKGYILLKMGKFDEAEIFINESITIDPNNAWAFRNKGIVHLNKGNVIRAIELLEHAIEIDMHVDDAYYYLAKAYFINGQIDLACISLSKAMELDSQKLIKIEGLICQ